MRPVRVFAPGKLFVVGEYLVLSGGRALVAALDAGITCAASASPAWRIVAPDLAVDLDLEAAMRHDGARLLAAAARSAALARPGLPPLRLRIEGAHPLSGRKRGLGGSAASVVAVMGAVAASAGESLRSAPVRARLFAAARAVHAERQNGKGSGADVAASVYGGWLDYSLGEGGARIAAAPVPADVLLSAAWSGGSIDTAAAIADFEARAGVVSPRLRAPLDRFWAALGNGDRAGMGDAISAYGERLAALEAAGPSAERRAALVAAARSAGAAAKGSGAVGGDCLIAIAFDRETIAAAEVAWLRLGAEVLDLRPDPRGVREEALHA